MPIMFSALRVTWLVSVLSLLSLASANANAADYYVHSLPGAPEGPFLKMHAGHIEVSPETNGNLFFWHFQNRHIANRQRTVIWLNGGPGCSSMDGALMEVGPYRLKKDQTLEYNPGRWDEFANLLFVDSPVGTGFSYVSTNSYLSELDDMATQFIVFMEKFFEMFPEFASDDLYLAGESYAGQYIPYIAKAIQERNKALTADGRPQWPLKGLLIGNGWVSPVEQYPSNMKFLEREGLIKPGTDVYQKLNVLNEVCLSKLEASEAKNKLNIDSCEFFVQEFLKLTLKETECYNVYDVRKKDTYPACGMNWPPDLKDITPYLQRPDVVKALNINPAKKSGWTECSGMVSKNFLALKSVPSIEFLPELIESGINVLLFNGDKDLVCNHLGTESLIHNMKWNGGTGFETSPGVWAPRHDWTFEGEPAGIYQHARNLTYVLFYNSSHMVPWDVPRQSRDMLDRFMKVDIASIGGQPTDSRIDGEKLPQTSVGGQANSTAAEHHEKEKLKQTEMHAYAKSGEAILIVLVIGVSIWGFFIWRSRRRAARSYKGVKDELNHSSLLNRFTNRSGNDVEAGDFDESELDNLNSPSAEHYAVGNASDDEHEHEHEAQHGTK